MAVAVAKDVALPTHAELARALRDAQGEDNGGLRNQMWAVTVDRYGIVTAVAYSGEAFSDQWPGGRVIAGQKANTANAVSTDRAALSTANLYAGAQPGGPNYGLLVTNPVNLHAAYDGDPRDYGTERDFMIGKQIGGICVFGGGLALYDVSGSVVGGLGVSGDYSCADHNIAWKVRHALELDYLPATNRDDNIIYDVDPKTNRSETGAGHVECTIETTRIAALLPQKYPLRRP